MASKKHLIAFENIPFGTEDWVVTRSNPRLWENDGVRNKFAAVFAPSYPEIEAAYAKAGKTVLKVDGVKVENDIEEDTYSEDEMENLNSPLTADDFIPKDEEETTDAKQVQEEEQEQGQVDWRDLPFFTMRSLANEYSDTLVKTKDQVVAVLEKAEAEGKI